MNYTKKIFLLMSVVVAMPQFMHAMNGGRPNPCSKLRAFLPVLLVTTALATDSGALTTFSPNACSMTPSVQDLTRTGFKCYDVRGQFQNGTLFGLTQNLCHNISTERVAGYLEALTKTQIPKLRLSDGNCAINTFSDGIRGICKILSDIQLGDIFNRG